MPHIPQDDIATRKREHLDLALNEAVRTHDAGFEAITLPYDALFEVSDSALDTHTSMAGHELSFPLMIGAMTGIADPAKRAVGSVKAALTAVKKGAHIVRVHDVAQTLAMFKEAGLR